MGSGEMMRANFPGLLIERERSGSPRYRVRVKGDRTKRVLIPVGPDHPDFSKHYHAARLGDRIEETKATPRSMQWLVDKYLAHLAAKVEAGLGSALTLKQRKSQLTRFCQHLDDDGDPYGISDIDAPPAQFVAIRDAWMKTPGEADNLMKSCRAMYGWACERGIVAVNPVKGIAKIHKSAGGAVPWTAADLATFREHYPLGTVQHAWLSLCMFTACRIGDARVLGRRHEVEIGGVTWLEWQPGKKGSAPMTLPMMPPLLRSLRALKIEGPTYLLTTQGKPFASVNSLGNTVREWCREAGLDNRSSHGIRKALAELLAEAGCSQHQIMAILAHTQAKTSEVYTKGAQRRLLAADAMQVLAGMEW